MKRAEFLQRWGLSGLKLKAGFLEADFAPNDPDRLAAWDLYIELLTRVATQRLPAEHGDEKTALDSVFSLFETTREILRKHGPGSNEFAKLAIPVLNQVIRPFTARWHKLSLAGAFTDPAQCAAFRGELAELQPKLRHYTQALAAMANVEDLTELEGEP
jgi:hypothetical protein